MANQKSDQVLNQDAVPAVPNSGNTDGVVRRKYFSGAVDAALGLAVGTLIDLCDLPKGARLLGGVWGNDATFSGAGVTLDIGWDGGDELGDGVDCASLNHTAINNTVALNFGTVLTADRRIAALVIGDVIVATGTYYGYIDYIM